jgi:imidazolonepropionase-like amidohydrolase
MPEESQLTRRQSRNETTLLTARYTCRVTLSRVRSLSCLTFISLICLISCSTPRPPSFAITHVTVIDVTGAPSQSDSTVVIADSRITAVGPSSSLHIPLGTKVIDASGKFLIPGLADMHVHLTGAGEPVGSRDFILPLLIANGVTTVRDMGGSAVLLKQLREEIASRDRIGPQIFFTGPYLDGDPPYFQPSIVVRRAQDAAAAVQQLKSDGVDFIKVQSRLQPDAYFAIAEASRRAGMRYVGHVPDAISARAASEAGQASIEHLTGVLLACSTREDELRRRQLAAPSPYGSVNQSLERLRVWQQDLLDSYSDEKAAKLFQTFVANHTWQVPTFPLLIHLAYLTPETDLASDFRVKYVPASVRKNWDTGRRENLSNQGAAEFQMRRELVKRSLSVFKQMYAAGVPVMTGTDTTAPNVFPGFALHEDLNYFVQAGLTPLQALQSATIKPAEFLGHAAEQGTIAPGKRADLVLLNANPLDDIRNTQKIDAVIVNGKLLNRGDLDALLARVAAFAASH